MKSLAIIWVLIVTSITNVHAVLDGRVVPNSVMLVQPAAKNPSPVKVTTPDNVLNCSSQEASISPSPSSTRLGERMVKAGVVFLCKQKNLSYGRFTADSCNDSVACRKALRDSNSPNAEKLLNEIVAKDVALNYLKTQTESMDNLELLKRFANTKYNIKSDKCRSRYEAPAKSNTCNLNLLDEVFMNEQEKCKSAPGCFNKSSPIFTTFKDYKNEKKLPKIAFVAEYNEYRINQELIKLKNEDDALINGLADLSMSAEFKGLSAEKKLDRFLKELESDSGDKYKDPFFAIYLGNVSEKDRFKKGSSYQFILKMFEKPALSREAFISSYEEGRRKAANTILNEKQFCSNIVDLKKVCEEMTKLSKGETIFKNPFEADALTSAEVNREDYSKFSSYFDKDFNENDYKLLINAKRCLSFELGSEERNVTRGDQVDNWYKTENSPKPSSDSDSVEVNVSTKVKAQAKSNYVSDGSPKSDSIDPKIIEPKLGDDIKSVTSLPTSSTNDHNNIVNQFNQAYTPSTYGLDNDEKKEKIDTKTEAPQITNPANGSSFENNMTDLMNRLTAAEDKVDKLTAANESAENERVKQKKIDEENVIIKDLQGQIAELKATKTKKENDKVAAVVNSAVEQPRAQSSNASSSSIVSSPARAPETSAKAPESFDSGRSTSSGSGSGSASGAGQSNTKSVNSALLTSSNNNEANKVLPSGTVYTTVDGMSSEKMIQTISKKIIELNGTPFYIQEGGVIKEIVAVVKDGKILLDEKGNPVYEKIIKGKIGDTKLAKTKDNKQAPTVITNAADLKRDQEEKLKRERAEYKKLKNLTNEAINKK